MSLETSGALTTSVIGAAAVGGALLSGVGAAYAATGSGMLPSAVVDCEARVTVGADLHLLPDVESPIRGWVAAGTFVTVVGTVHGSDGALWLRLENGLYVPARLTRNLTCVLQF